MSVPPFRPPVPEPLHEFGWPRPAASLEFRVTQPFDAPDSITPEVKHRALDLGNGHLGAPITSPAPGRVIAEGFLTLPWSSPTDLYGTGNYGGIMCVIDHGDGWVSALAHLADTIVSVNQPILDGQLLGHLGATGAAKVGGGHVHWDLYHNGVKVDPWPLLRQNYRLPDTATAPGDTDMRFSGSELHIVDGTPAFRLVADAHFRASTSRASASLAVFKAGTTVRAAWSVDGEVVNGNDDWVLTAMYVGTAFVTGYFHASVLELLAPPAADCSAAIAEAVAAARAPLVARIINAQKALQG